MEVKRTPSLCVHERASLSKLETAAENRPGLKIGPEVGGESD